MSSKVNIAEWDNNKSLKFLQVRYTDVLGRFSSVPRGFRQKKLQKIYLLNQVVFEDFLLF
jgi:hypothetical protein